MPNNSHSLKRTPHVCVLPSTPLEQHQRVMWVLMQQDLGSISSSLLSSASSDYIFSVKSTSVSFSSCSKEPARGMRGIVTHQGLKKKLESNQRKNGLIMNSQTSAGILLAGTLLDHQPKQQRRLGDPSSNTISTLRKKRRGTLAGSYWQLSNEAMSYLISLGISNSCKVRPEIRLRRAAPRNKGKMHREGAAAWLAYRMPPSV